MGQLGFAGYFEACCGVQEVPVASNDGVVDRGLVLTANRAGAMVGAPAMPDDQGSELTREALVVGEQSKPLTQQVARIYRYPDQSRLNDAAHGFRLQRPSLSGHGR